MRVLLIAVLGASAAASAQQPAPPFTYERPVLSVRVGTKDSIHTPIARSEKARPSAPVYDVDGGAQVSEGAVLEGEFPYSRPLLSIPSAGGLITVPLDAAILSHSRGPNERFADVRIVDADHRQVPYLLEQQAAPLALAVSLRPESVLPAAIESAGALSAHRSAYRIELPYDRLPAGTLVVETTARVFQRIVRLVAVRPADRTHRGPYGDVLSTTNWTHREDEAATAVLSLPVESAGQTALWLIVDEGDNAALPLSAARLLLPSYRLRFFAPAGRPLRVVYGRADLEPPRYDLSLLAGKIADSPATEVFAGAEPARAVQAPLISPGWFTVLMGGAAAVLLLIIARLVRRA